MAGRSSFVKIVVVLLVLGIGALVALLLFGRGPKPIQTTNVLGEPELCQSCHPVAKHPAVVGHAKLGPMGCVPCHGGDASKLKKELAHAPALGDGREPFLPKGRYQVGCARCHIPGQVKGMEQIVAGQLAFRQGTCVGCHGPGHQPPEIGPSLRLVPQKNEAYLRRWLIDSRAVLYTAAMWSVRDATYRDYFGDTKEGRARIEALISYVLTVSDEPQRKGYSEHAHKPKLRIDRPCTSCHTLDGKKTAGKPHRCTMLRGNKLLTCARCHGSEALRPKSKARMCPQVAASVHLCETCHLRENDGFKELRQRARRLR